MIRYRRWRIISPPDRTGNRRGWFRCLAITGRFPPLRRGMRGIVGHPGTPQVRQSVAQPTERPRVRGAPASPAARLAVRCAIARLAPCDRVLAVQGVLWSRRGGPISSTSVRRGGQGENP